MAMETTREQVERYRAAGAKVGTVRVSPDAAPRCLRGVATRWRRPQASTLKTPSRSRWSCGARYVSGWLRRGSLTTRRRREVRSCAERAPGQGVRR